MVPVVVFTATLGSPLRRPVRRHTGPNAHPIILETEIVGGGRLVLHQVLKAEVGLTGPKPARYMPHPVQTGIVAQGRHQIKADHAAPHRLGMKQRAPALAGISAYPIALRIAVHVLTGAYALLQAEHGPGIVKVVVGAGKADDIGIPRAVLRPEGADGGLRAAG